MFKITIWYDETINHKDVPESVGIMYINCVKVIMFWLDNKTIENFITTFVTNIMFHNVGLSWIMKANKKLDFFPNAMSFLDNKWYMV